MGLAIQNCRLSGKRLGSVVVEEGRVTEVAVGSGARPPPGSAVIDARGAALLTGFVDTRSNSGG
jgi:dihydroorotase-like cyclic amidohydrolase